jgi:hypothetical protein
MPFHVLNPLADDDIASLASELAAISTEDDAVHIVLEFMWPPDRAGGPHWTELLQCKVYNVAHILNVFFQNPVTSAAVIAAVKVVGERAAKWAMDYKRKKGKKVAVMLYGPDGKLINSIKPE